jgi:hypothetical protein
MYTVFADITFSLNAMLTFLLDRPGATRRTSGFPRLLHSARSLRVLSFTQSTPGKPVVICFTLRNWPNGGFWSHITRHHQLQNHQEEHQRRRIDRVAFKIVYRRCRTFLNTINSHITIKTELLSVTDTIIDATYMPLLSMRFPANYDGYLGYLHDVIVIAEVH